MAFASAAALASAAAQILAVVPFYSSTDVVAKGSRGKFVALILHMLHGLLQRVHRLVVLKHVLQVGVQEVYLQGLLTVLHVILVLLVNPVLSVIPMLVLLVIYLLLFLMMMQVFRRRLLLRILILDLCSVLAHVFFLLSRSIIIACFRSD